MSKAEEELNKWLKFAEENFEIAELLFSNLDSCPYYIQLGYWSQMTAVNYLKCFLISAGEQPLPLYNLHQLLYQCEKYEKAFKSISKYCDILDRYCDDEGVERMFVDGHYGETFFEVNDKQEVIAAFKAAKEIRDFVLALISHKNQEKQQLC